MVGLMQWIVLGFVAPIFLVACQPRIRSVEQSNVASSECIVDQQTGFAGGSGSVSDPFLICNDKMLDQIRYHLNDSFKLTADIDLSGKTISPIPVNYNYQDYSGVFDGNGHKILNWNSITNSLAHFGLFTQVSGTIKNLTMVDPTLTFNTTGEVNVRIGAMVGFLNGGILQNCSLQSSYDIVVNSIGSGGTEIGSLVGAESNSDIDGANVTLKNGARINAPSGAQVGGFIGAFESGSGKNINVEFSGDAKIYAASSAYVGGAIGNTGAGASIESISVVMKDDSSIESTVDSYLGGISGACNDCVSKVGISVDMYSNAKIFATNNRLGGIFGTVYSGNDGGQLNVTGAHALRMHDHSQLILSANGGSFSALGGFASNFLNSHNSTGTTFNPTFELRLQTSDPTIPAIRSDQGSIGGVFGAVENGTSGIMAAVEGTYDLLIGENAVIQSNNNNGTAVAVGGFVGQIYGDVDIDIRGAINIDGVLLVGELSSNHQDYQPNTGPDSVGNMGGFAGYVSGQMYIGSRGSAFEVHLRDSGRILGEGLWTIATVVGNLNQGRVTNLNATMAGKISGGITKNWPHVGGFAGSLDNQSRIDHVTFEMTNTSQLRSEGPNMGLFVSDSSGTIEYIQFTGVSSAGYLPNAPGTIGGFCSTKGTGTFQHLTAQLDSVALDPDDMIVGTGHFAGK